MAELLEANLLSLAIDVMPGTLLSLAIEALPPIDAARKQSVSARLRSSRSGGGDA